MMQYLKVQWVFFSLEFYSSSSSCHCEQYIRISVSRSINLIDEIHNIWLKIKTGLQFSSSWKKEIRGKRQNNKNISILHGNP